jgi:hypothetical protein
MKQFLKNIAEDIVSLSAYWVFVVLCVFHAIAIYFQQQLILTDEVYYNSLGEQLTYERIEILLNAQKNKVWLAYALIPVLTVLQCFLIAICLNTGTLLREHTVRFRQLFALATKAMLIPACFKIVILIGIYFLNPVNSLDDLANAFTFSLANLFDVKALPVWLQYPLATLNLGEFLFWLFLAEGIRYLLKWDFNESFSFVGYTYGTGLVLWVLLIVFLQVSLME